MQNLNAAADYQAQRAAELVLIAQLVAVNPRLVPVSADCDGLIAASKNVRIELKAAFPGVKFAVKTSRFSMGDSLSVSWTDGPTTEQVDAIVSRYEAGQFNSSDDCYNYVPSIWRKAFGDAKFVHTSREHSDRAIQSAMRTVFARYAGNLQGVSLPTIAEFRNGSLYRQNVSGLQDDMQRLILTELSRRTWALRAKRAN